MLDFQWPWVLLLLVLVGFAFVWWVFFKRSGVVSFFWPFVFFCGIIGLILSLARPRDEDEMSKDIRRSGSEIIFLVDVSQSMDVNDTGDIGDFSEESRLDVAVRFVQGLVKRLPAHYRYGLMCYAGSFELLLPLSQVSPELFGFFLKRMRENRSRLNASSLLTYALGNVIQHFPKARSWLQVLVIISDGEDFSHEYMPSLRRDDLIKKADSRGIKIISIGVGSASGGPLPEASSIYSLQDSEALRSLAEEGGGRLWLIDGKSMAFDEVESFLKDYEGSDAVDGNFATYGDELFSVYGFSSLMLMLIFWVSVHYQLPSQLKRSFSFQKLRSGLSFFRDKFYD